MLAEEKEKLRRNEGRRMKTNRRPIKSTVERMREFATTRSAQIGLTHIWLGQASNFGFTSGRLQQTNKKTKRNDMKSIARKEGGREGEEYATTSSSRRGVLIYYTTTKRKTQEKGE
jgi:hypothetical protein